VISIAQIEDHRLQTSMAKGRQLGSNNNENFVEGFLRDRRDVVQYPSSLCASDHHADQPETNDGVWHGRCRGHCGFRQARRNVLRRDQDGRYRDLNHAAIAIVLLTMLTDRIWQSAVHLGNGKEVMSSLDLQFPPGAILMPAVDWLHVAGDEHAT
jgi:hypothetical protein